jgi:hypothetical protein
MPPPHTVGKCDHLGAVGQWEEISPPALTKEPLYTGAEMVIVDPHTAGTVYLTTSKNGLFKSTDCGASFVKQNTGRNGAQLDSGQMWSAAIDPIEPNTLYAITGYGPAGLWKTTNGGVDWDNVLPTDMGMPGFVARVNIDPTNHLHILINFHDNCTAGHTPVCFGESKDGGKTWAVLDFPSSLKNAWGEGTAIIPIDATHWLLEFWELYYTADAGANWKQVDTGGAAAIQGPYFRIPKGTFFLSTANGMITSPDGASWSRVQNSGSGFDAVSGDGKRVFAAKGFQPPDGLDFMWSASYDNPSAWVAMPTPGLPAPLISGANWIDSDVDHHIVYSAILGAGLWRVVTESGAGDSAGATGGGAGGASGNSGSGGAPAN